MIRLGDQSEAVRHYQESGHMESKFAKIYHASCARRTRRCEARRSKLCLPRPDGLSV